MRIPGDFHGGIAVRCSIVNCDIHDISQLLTGWVHRVDFLTVSHCGHADSFYAFGPARQRELDGAAILTGDGAEYQHVASPELARLHGKSNGFEIAVGGLPVQRLWRFFSQIEFAGKMLHRRQSTGAVDEVALNPIPNLSTVDNTLVGEGVNNQIGGGLQCR